MDVGGALDVLRRLGERRLLLDLRHVVAVEHVEAAGLLQVGDQDGLGLAAEAIDAVGEDAAHEARAVVELAHRDEAARAVVRGAGGGDLGDFERARLFGGAAGHEGDAAEQHDSGSDFTEGGFGGHVVGLRVMPKR